MKSSRIRALFADRRGALLTEYVILTGFIAFGASSAVLFCAYMVAGNFAAVRNYILCPVP